MKPTRKSRVAPARAATAKKVSKPKKPAAESKSSRDKVRAHRARMREQGMRPMTIWVPDVRSPKFAAEARRQCKLANASPYAADDQAWVDAMSDWSAD
jgi:hypothetical protein